MIYMLDANAFSDLTHDRGGIRSRFKATRSPDRISASVIVVGEVLHGLRRMTAGRRQQDLQAQLVELFDTVPCEPTPCSAAEHYAHIKASRQRAGLPMDENDLWIAAAALALGATLITRDTDFRAVAGLAVEDWTI